MGRSPGGQDADGRRIESFDIQKRASGADKWVKGGNPQSDCFARIESVHQFQHAKPSANSEGEKQRFRFL